jgi:hypothetical protein
MDEKIRNIFALIGICVVIFILGFFVGGSWGRNIQRSAGLADTDQRIEQAIKELGREFEQERAIGAGLGNNSERERQVIGRIAESTRQARMDTNAIIPLGTGAENSIQKIITKVEILNRYLGDNERWLDEYRYLSGVDEIEN